MVRMIEDENLIKYIKSEEFAHRVIRSKDSIRDILIEVINEQPTVDAAPVIHGRWSMVKMGENIALAKCSACGRKMNVSHYGSLYCGLCGAKMDGGEKK